MHFATLNQAFCVLPVLFPLGIDLLEGRVLGRLVGMNLLAGLCRRHQISSERTAGLTPFCNSLDRAIGFLWSYSAIIVTLASYAAAWKAAWYSFGSLSHSFLF